MFNWLNKIKIMNEAVIVPRPPREAQDLKA